MFEKPKGQSKMNNPKTLATQDTGQCKQNTTQKTKNMSKHGHHH